MTVYWCDPYLEASTQGNGTTDTSTRSGTYAAPFSLSDLNNQSTASPNVHTYNSVALADGDELRFKGLPFSTLFESWGDVYCSGSNLVRSSGNSQDFSTPNWNAGSGNGSSSISHVFAIPDTICQAMTGNWTHPLFITHNGDSNSSQLNFNACGNFIQALQFKGYDINNPFTLYHLKDTYFNKHNFPSGATYYMATGTSAVEIKFSAGWTSTTSQDGWSIFENGMQSNFNQWRLGIYNDGSKFDLLRMPMITTQHYGSSGGYAYVYNYFSETTFTHQVYQFHWWGAGSNYVYGSTTNVEYYQGGGQSQRDQYIYGYGSVYKKPLSIGTSSDYFRILTNGSETHIGDTFQFASNTGDRRGFTGDASTNNFNLYFMNNSSYYFAQLSSGGFLDWFGSGNRPTITYGTNLSRPTVGKLSPWSSTSYVQPTAAVTSGLGFAYCKENLKLSGNNWWDTQIEKGNSSNPIVIGNVGLLECNGNNYKTTNPDMKVNAIAADYDQTNNTAVKLAMFSCEANDYDGKPVLLLWTHNITSDAVITPHLAWNDTVGSDDVLTVRYNQSNEGSLSNMESACIPLELKVPDYTQASDNLRLKVSMSYETTGTATSRTLGTVTHFRNSAVPNNLGIVARNHTINTSSTPTVVYSNLSGNSSPNDSVPTSGQTKITSVLVALYLGFEKSATIAQKFHLHSAEIETY
tara:strand:- start:7651 stop:9723 length:2073 start_codon:yes stop_codon:yes gene_type:complete